MIINPHSLQFMRGILIMSNVVEKPNLGGQSDMAIDGHVTGFSKHASEYWILMQFVK
jgi:hypothetical protein